MPIQLQNPIPGQATTTIGWWNLDARNEGPGQIGVSVQWGPVDATGRPARELATGANSGSFDFTPDEVAAFTAAGIDAMILARIQAHVPAAAGAVT